MHRVACGVGGVAFLVTCMARADDGHVIPCPRAYQRWTALAATYAATSRTAIALEPHYLAEASPFAARDAGAIAAVEVAARDWLVIDAAIDVVGWDQRSVTAIVGASLAPARLWGGR